MKILYICEEYPPGWIGGIGTMVQTLAREAVRQGHSVFVVGLYPHGYDQPNYEIDQGVQVWRFRYRTDIGIAQNNVKFRSRMFLKTLRYSTILHFDVHFSLNKMFRFIKNLIDKYQIDIIEIPDWNVFFQNSLTVIKIPHFKIPLVTKCNGSYSYFAEEMNKPLNNTIYNSEKSLFLRSEAVAAVSQYTAEKTKSLFDLKKPVEILYNCIRLPDIDRQQRDDNTVIFTGTLAFKKGIFSLIKAWNIVIEKIPSARLKVFGKGRIEMVKKLLSEKAAASVTFYGHVGREIIFRELAQATMAIFPSYSECFALAPLEAMAVGCPVINTRRASGTELTTNYKTGMLIDPDDVGGIADTIVELFSNKPLREQLSVQGQAHVAKSFNIENSVKLHIEFYKKVITNFKQTEFLTNRTAASPI